ncbi:hypothetical protein [Parasitella parasitica]|uniref:Uncharacterized protein n=1 Tax=Parasitella parasitica TaxID=35722 RepID=A0A0B7N383_9FUNG|nr:hypothetical protein [Parasitella parasitica]
MFDEDEEELELLRQYENKDLAEDEEHLSSEEIDSDLEDKIMSMVQYGTGITKKKASPTQKDVQKNSLQAKVVYAPMDSDKSDDERPAFSSASEFCIDNTDSEDDTHSATVYSGEESDHQENSGVPELIPDVPAERQTEQPRVTRYIDMDEEEKRYLDDEHMSEEEAELGLKLQKLIDEQTARCVASVAGPNIKMGAVQLLDTVFDASFEATMQWIARAKGRWTTVATAMRRTITPTYVLAYCISMWARKRRKQFQLPGVTIAPSEGITAMSARIYRRSRYDPKKIKKSSYQSKRQRPSDSSRDSSPHRDYYESGYRDNKRTRHKYNDSDDDHFSRYSRSAPSKSNSNSNSNSNSRYKNTNNNNSNLNGFFSHQLPQQSSQSSSSSSNNRPNNRSGNSNWKAMNNNTLPQPTRSGTVNVHSFNNSVQHRQDYGDFPRGNGSTSLPKPSSSGVIDLSGNSRSRGGEYASRGPKYHGGYSRNR